MNWDEAHLIGDLEAQEARMSDDLVKRLPQMTDEELIASLRMIHEWKIGFVAADRIEALARNLANTQADFTEQLGRATAYELRMIDAEAYAEELEAKLAKALEMLRALGVADAILAELTGGKDDQ